MAVAVVDNSHGCHPSPVDGGFGGRLGSVTPFPKPPKKEMPKWKTKANDGHSFVRARSEHVLTQLHAWACAVTCTGNMDIAFRTGSRNCIGWCVRLCTSNNF